MAVLSAAARREIWAKFMEDASNDREAVGVNKADLRAAFDALDDWMDANATTLNQAIPQPARANLTVPQKARILMEVVRQRYVKGA